MSLRKPTPQLNQRSPSASSHYFNLRRLSLVIPVVLLLLLSTIIDVTGKQSPTNPSSAPLISSDDRNVLSFWFFDSRESNNDRNNMTSFIKHFDHISAGLRKKRSFGSSCWVNNRNKSKMLTCSCCISFCSLIFEIEKASRSELKRKLLFKWSRERNTRVACWRRLMSGS